MSTAEKWHTHMGCERLEPWNPIGKTTPTTPEDSAVGWSVCEVEFSKESLISFGNSWKGHPSKSLVGRAGSVDLSIPASIWQTNRTHPNTKPIDNSNTKVRSLAPWRVILELPPYPGPRWLSNIHCATTFGRGQKWPKSDVEPNWTSRQSITVRLSEFWTPSLRCGSTASVDLSPSWV